MTSTELPFVAGLVLTPTIQVSIPPDSKPGDIIQVMSPGGRTIQVTIPDGVLPGGVMEVANPDIQAPTKAEDPSVDADAAASPASPNQLLIERCVKMSDRPNTDRGCLVAFLAAIVAFVAISIALGASAHPRYKLNDGMIDGVHAYWESKAESCCDKTGDYWQMSEMCFQMEKAGQWVAPESDRRLDAVRRLGHNDRPHPDNVWEGFGFRPEIPASLLSGCVLVCIIFLKCMEKCSSVMLFGTFFAQVVGAIVLGVKDGIRAEYLIAAVLIMIWVGWQRKNIQQAAKVTGAAAHALLQMPSLMLTVFSWLFVSAALVAILIVVASAAGSIATIEETETEMSGYDVDGNWVEDAYTFTQCQFKAADWATNSFFIAYLIWQWMWMYSTALQVFLVAGCVGVFHFSRDLVTPQLPVQFIKMGVTTSAGTVSVSALILAIVEQINKYGKFKCGWCCCQLADPFFWIAALIKCCCITYLRMITKFSLIFHVFSGEKFWTSAERTAELLKKNGMKALVMETSAINCFFTIGYFLSVGFAFSCWAWMGVEYDKDILGDPSAWQWGSFIKWLMSFLTFVLMTRPTCALLLIVWIATSVGDAINPLWIPWCCGIFTGAVVALFFHQTTSALLTASDTMFVAIAVDREHAHAGDQDNAFYILMTEQIAEAKCIDNDGNIVANTQAVANPVSSGERV